MSAVAIVELVYHRSPLIMRGGQYLSRLLAVQTISGSMLMGPTTSDASPDRKSGHDLTAGFVIKYNPIRSHLQLAPLACKDLQVVEVYDVEPWTSDHPQHPIYGMVAPFGGIDVLSGMGSDGFETRRMIPRNSGFAYQLIHDTYPYPQRSWTCF